MDTDYTTFNSKSKLKNFNACSHVCSNVFDGTKPGLKVAAEASSSTPIIDFRIKLKLP